MIDWDSLGFDACRTNAVIVSCYKDGEWSPIEITDTFSFSLNPFASVFHYAISCFEGLKAFRQKDGKAILFRPDRNAARMARTADYLGMPVPLEELFIKMCSICVKENIDFLPPYGHQASMYIRPLLMGMHPQISLTPYPEAVFAVMCAPVGSFYGSHLRAFKAVIPGNYDRAAPKGSGSYKMGANYAATFKPYKIAHEQGYTEILFLNSSTREYIDEFGSSNFFGIRDGEYITPLSDSVLPSVTNLSLQEIAADLGMKVQKRPVPVDELESFQEAGGCGTAVVIAPMSRIDVKPLLEEPAITRTFNLSKDGSVGPICTQLYNTITGIQFGELEYIHSWCQEV